MVLQKRKQELDRIRGPKPNWCETYCRVTKQRLMCLFLCLCQVRHEGCALQWRIGASFSFASKQEYVACLSLLSHLSAD